MNGLRRPHGLIAVALFSSPTAYINTPLGKYEETRSLRGTSATATVYSSNGTISHEAEVVDIVRKTALEKVESIR